MNRRLDADAEAGHILGRQQSFVLAVEGDDGGGNIAPVECIARRFQALFAALAGGGGLFIGPM
jgi:hypothetical protein